MAEDSTSEGGPSAPQGDLADRVSILERRVDELADDLDEMIADVRRRVVQVKRETDEKAPVDHDHDALEAAVEDLETVVEEAVVDPGDRDALDDRLEDLDHRLEAGFENYEEVLEYLVETAETVDGRVDTLRDAVASLRESVARLEARRAGHAAADRLREQALSHGVTAAKCEACGGEVVLGLLTEARCPHCQASLSALEPRRGFFRSSVLRTGEPPALEGGGADDAPDLAGAAREGSRTAPSVSASAATGDAGEQAVDTVPGIGSAYAGRLEAAGIETVADLADGDAATIAERAEVGTGRVESWIERARGRLGGE